MRPDPDSICGSVIRTWLFKSFFAGGLIARKMKLCGLKKTMIF